jgi:hypothetical protein
MDHVSTTRVRATSSSLHGRTINITSHSILASEEYVNAINSRTRTSGRVVGCMERIKDQNSCSACLPHGLVLPQSSIHTHTTMCGSRSHRLILPSPPVIASHRPASRPSMVELLSIFIFLQGRRGYLHRDLRSAECLVLLSLSSRGLVLVLPAAGDDDVVDLFTHDELVHRSPLLGLRHTSQQYRSLSPRKSQRQPHVTQVGSHKPLRPGPLASHNLTPSWKTGMRSHHDTLNQARKSRRS